MMMPMSRVLVPLHISAELPPDGGAVHDFSGSSMGTGWSVKLAVDARQSVAHLRAGIQDRLDAVEREMSHWSPDSDLGRFNRAQAGNWHDLPDAFFEVLSYALGVAEESGGAYDPAAGALLNLWGFGPDGRHDTPGFTLPSAEAVRVLAENPGWRSIALDRARRRLMQPGGVLLDLSAVAKGYAVDAVARYLERQGIRHYMVEVGGELRGAGMKPDGQPWWVVLEQPPGRESEKVLLALHGLSVATSGDYGSYFRREDTIYPHTLDPRSGYPIRNDVASVTVVHENCMAADALSTVLTVLGLDEGLCFAEARCLAARFLIRDGERLIEHMTSDFRALLQ